MDKQDEMDKKEGSKGIGGILYSNCSEAVFRFHTIEPDKVWEILQAIADEISHNTDFEAHKNQKVPEFPDVMMYDTKYTGEPTYSCEEYDKQRGEINQVWKERDEGKITQDEALEKYGKIREEIDNLVYPNSLLRACAGLGDNDAVITVHKDKGFFTLNIGNNDIEKNETGWVEKIEGMGIRVEEAEYDKSLQKIARDCTCGIVFGFGRDRKIKTQGGDKD